MKSNTQLLAVAKAQLGNTGGKYRKYAGYGGSWCNMFVYWLFNANGCATLFPMKTQYQKTYCPTSIKWCNKNLAQIPPYLAMPCDIIYFDWDKNNNPNHIGIVESRVNTEKIDTIEGNTNGGKVARKTRPKKYIQAIYRPHFAHSFSDKALKLDKDFGYQTVGGLQKTLKILGYYNGKIDCILGKATVRALQKLVGCKDDGAWGATTSGKTQQYLKNKGYYTGKVDKEFGEQSVLAMQKWVNTNAYQSKPTTSKPAPTKPATTKTTYCIDVDLTNQICTVYKNGKAVMSEFVSTARKGKTTPIGNFKIQGAKNLKAKYRTAKLSGGKSYAEYLTRFKGAKCMHCVPYSKRNTKGYVNKNEFNKLGTPRSAGCVRMPNKLAKYIYTTCPVGTPVHVFKGKAGSYPMGKPKKYTATSNVDPTYKK